MNVTIERAVRGSIAADFLELYREAFSPLAVLGAQRQQLHDDEFLACLRDDRVLKLIGWDDDGHPVAMAVMARDLELLPWFSPAFFAQQLPRHTERDAVLGIIAILVHPSAQGGPWYRAMAEAVALKAWTDQAVVVFDCCAYNVDVFPLPATLEKIGLGLFEEINLVELDTQHYYSLDAQRLRLEIGDEVGLAGGEVTLARDQLEAESDAVIDLDEVVIDLRDHDDVPIVRPVGVTDGDEQAPS